MVQIVLVYGLPQINFYCCNDALQKNTKAKTHSFDCDIDFYYVLAGVFPGDTLALYLLKAASITYYKRQDVI